MVQEIVEFAKKMGYKKLGIATCVGLIRETKLLTDILRSHGFEVFGIACKAGAVPKVKMGIDRSCCEGIILWRRFIRAILIIKGLRGKIYKSSSLMSLGVSICFRVIS